MKRKLSPYTIASNCTDITDCNDGIDEIFEAFDRYDGQHKKRPLYLYNRLEKLKAKRDKCSLKEHGMKYDDYLLSRDLGKTDEKIKFNFRNQLNQFFANTFVGRFIGVTMPKKILLDCGIPNLPIMINKRTLFEKIELHSLKKEHLKNLNTDINSPIFVFKSETIAGAYNIIVEKSNDEGVLCVSLHTNKSANKILINEIASIHGRRVNQITKWVEDGFLLMANQDKAKKVFRGSRFNSVQSEYLLSLIDNANIEKDSENQTDSQENLGSYDKNDNERLKLINEKSFFNYIAKNESRLISKIKSVYGGKTKAFNEDDIRNDFHIIVEKYRIIKGIDLLDIENELLDTIKKVYKDNNEPKQLTETGTFKFAQHLSELYSKGEKLDWLKAKKIAKDFDIETETEIMQACELGVVLEARRIANNGNSLRQQYEEMKDLYERQVTIRPLDTKSKVLQQYSTPCPLSYLLGRFVGKNDKFCNGKILEPSAGNGLLTIAFPPQQVCVNELDEIRVANLKNLGFSSVTNQNASSNLELAIFPDKAFRGIMTNPPFAKLNENDKIERHGWKINTLDYKMAVLALDKMHNDGKAAVIVGGKLWNAYWKPLNERSSKQVLFGQWKTFLGYLYAQYNVVDVIYIDGDHIYQKQGTTYPIVVILIDGRHEYDESNKPRYVFDPYQDTILTTFDQLFDRLYPFIETKQDNSDDKRKKAKALMLKMKMTKIKL
ncbi:MAG: hypothetical protein J6W37_05655 [Bacteroidales bacterium]|nr:hypothetical protein [Bacteroidales bacterium]